MKTNPALILAAAATFLTLTGCDKKPAGGAAPAVVDEKTAIANFKAEVEGFSKWAEAQKPATNDPSSMVTAIGEVITKFKGIRTDGLPADLKGAWGEMGGVLTEMGDIFKGMPKMDAAKPEDLGKVMGEIMPKMMAIQAKMEPVGKKLEELGKKYGLDLSKVAQGK